MPGLPAWSPNTGVQLPTDSWGLGSARLCQRLVWRENLTACPRSPQSQQDREGGRTVCFTVVLGAGWGLAAAQPQLLGRR